MRKKNSSSENGVLNAKLVVAKDCECATDSMVLLGIAVACLPCTKLRHKKGIA